MFGALKSSLIDKDTDNVEWILNCIVLKY
jgi:hypothetical protein